MHGSAPNETLLSAAATQISRTRCQQWLLVLLTGFTAAVMAFSINVGIEGLDKLRYSLAFWFIQPGGGFFLAWLVFSASSCAISAVAALGVVYISPLAAGSGIPHIKAYCNGIDIPGLLTFKTLMVKLIGAMFSIGSGLVAGKEGPFIQCGACIAYVISNISKQISNWHTSKGNVWAAGVQRLRQLYSGCLPRHLSSESNGLPVANSLADNQLTAVADGAVHRTVSAQLSPGATGCKADPEQQQRIAQPTASQSSQQDVLQCSSRHKQLQHDKVAMGAGAGVAAAFIAPLAGAAYSIEEASSIYSGSMFTQTFLVGAVMVFFLWVFTTAGSSGNSALNSTMFQNPLALAFRGQYGTVNRFWWYAWEVPLLLVLGVLGGLIMAAWTALNIKLQVARKAVFKAGWVKVLDVVLCCLLTNTIRLLAAYMSPCVPVPVQADMAAWQEQIVSWQFFDAPSGMFPQLWCPDNTYSVYGQLFMQPLDVSVRTLFTFDATHNHRDTTQIWNTYGPVNSSTVQDAAGAVSPSAPEVDVFKAEALVAYFMFTWGMLLLSYGISAPTGIFIPCLSAGAAGGRLAGHLLQHALRRAGIFLPICMPSWSVLGAAAMLTGCTRLAMSNCLIVMESSGAVQLVVPMAMLMTAAKLVADGLIIGIYDYQIEAAGYLFLPPADMMSSREVAVMQHRKALDLVPNQASTGSDTNASTQISSSQTQATTQPDGMNPQQHSLAGSSTAAVAGPFHATRAGFEPVAAAVEAGMSHVNCHSSIRNEQQQELHSSAGSSWDSRTHVVDQDAVVIANDCSNAAAAAPTEVAAPGDIAAGQALLTAPPAAAFAAAATVQDSTADAAGYESLASAVLLVSANSSIHSAYTAMRELALDQLPVVLLPQSGRSSHGSCSSAYNRSLTRHRSTAAGAHQQLAQHAGVQHHGQGADSSSSAADNTGSDTGHTTARVIYTLHRKDMVPCVMLKTVKDKQD